MEYDEELDLENFENFLSKDKSLAQKRHNDVTKALRKRRIAHSYSLFAFTGWYNNLHQYSKNKIHCSCPMCTQKTNNRGRHKYYGKGSKNWKHSDLVKINRLESQLEIEN